MFETPGQILRVHREKLKLSAQDIAKRIHLDIKIIEAIENDSSEGMPTAIYVRGYLRSYAKIVDADADKIIELYNADSPAPPPEILPEVKPPSQVSSNDKPVKAFTYLITLGLVLLLLIWYQSNFIVEPKINNAPENTPTNINGVDVTYKVINHPDSWQSPKNTIEEAISETVVETVTTEPQIEEGSTELEDFDEQKSEATPIEITDNNLSSPFVGQGPDTIEMTLTSDSWIEVVDSMNNKLFHDLAVSGEEYNLKGTAPFNITLGFSRGVKLSFNGKPFDIESHSKNGVARFTLPQ